MNNSSPDAKYDARKSNAGTLVGILWTDSNLKFQKIAGKYPDHAKEIEFLKLYFLRWLEPWPDWVLRISAEVLHVYVPKIKQREILEFLRLAHWFFYELKIHEEKIAPPVKLPPDFQKKFIQIIGHVRAHFFRIPQKISQIEGMKLSPSQISELNEIKGDWGKNTQKMGKLFVEFLAAIDANKHSQVMGTLLKAENGTFDDQGRLRDTSATEIYKRILESWPEVELFSGTAELCDFLAPVLGSGGHAARDERVKKIVTRMGIAFRPHLSRDKLIG